MAAKHFYRQGFLLLLFNFICTAALEKRFSDFKRCADEECSMLLVRGKALKDFTGPDCRFLPVKASETIYVYYKLSGRRDDLWAGSVGSHFGYFPKDLMAVNHKYTDKEVEVPAEETDFVCFDTGLDKFNTYDVDLLLGSSLEENDNENKVSSDQLDVSETETQTSADEETDGEIPDDQSASIPELDVATDATERASEHREEGSKTKDTSSSEGRQIPKLKTTFGTTFDAVTSNDEITKNVTPYDEEEEEEGEVIEHLPEDDEDVEEGTPLLSFSEQNVNTPTSDSLKTSEGVHIPKLKTTFGSTFDAVTSNDEITESVTPYDSDDEEEGEVMEHHPEDDEDVEEGTPLLSFSEQNMNAPSSDSLKTSEGVQIPKLKTTFGTTFDAVTSDDEITKKVTPYVEEEGEDEEYIHEDDSDVEVGTPLLSFSEQNVNSPSSDSPKTEEELVTKEDFASENQPRVTISEGRQIPDLKTTFGTTFDAVTTNEEITKKVTPYEEEESEDVENLPEDDSDVVVGTPLLSFAQPTMNIPSSDSPKTSEGRQIPKLKTTFGMTFDAVTTNEEITKKVTPYEEVESEDVEHPFEDDVDVKAGTPLLSFAKQTINMPSSDSLKTSEGRQIPKLKTTFGTTFDAVTSNEEITKKVTPYDEEESEGVEHPPEDDTAVKEETPLLSFSEKNANSPTNDDKPESVEEKNIWTSFGDAVFSAITGVEKTSQDVSSDEDEEDEEEAAPKTPLSFDQIKKALEEQRSVESENMDPIDSSSTQTDIKETDSDSERLSSDDEDDDEGDVEEVGPEDTWEEKLEPTEEPIHHQTEESKTSVDLESEVTSSDNDDDEKTADDSLHNQIHDHESTDLESNKSKPEILLEEAENHEELLSKEWEDENTKTAVMKEELLEDENALSVSELDNKDSDEPLAETAAPAVSTPEPEYSDSVLRLTLLRDHFSEEEMERIQKLLGLKNLFKVEAMFSDLDTELQVTRLSHTGTTQDMENALEGILEASENTILDEVEKMLDSRDTKPNYDQNVDTSKLDEETEILDDFQELAFSLRQKYSTASDSTPLATEQGSDIGQDKHELNTTDEMPPIVEKGMVDIVPETEGNDRHTVTDNKEMPTETKEELIVLDEVHSGPDISVKEDGGHFNKNKYNQPGFSGSEEMPRVPQATLENPLDRGLGVEVEQSPSGSLESIEQVSKIQEEVGLFSTGVVYMGCILSMIKTKIAEWTIMVISLLPEEWKPGETLFGCPWQAVIVTALIGVMTFTLFFWRTVLAVKKREYLVDDKKLTEQMQALKKEKNDALTKMSELQKQTEQLKDHQKESNKSVSSTMKRMQVLESTVLEAETRNEKIVAEKDKYAKLLKDERANSQQHEARIAKLEKSNEKLQLSRKKIQEAFAKTAVLLDEAKIREDARNVQHKCLEKDHGTLKEENKSLKANIKGWESKHKELNEQIKVYQKSQKELEDSVVLKDHNVEVLSELLADLDACDSQKGESKVLANGEIAADKKTAIKNRIKQMMDVSRVHTTLTVVEEERDRFMTKLLNEEKARKSMEEQHQELEHAIATLKRDKSHVETQFTILQQKNEIMVEMYQQKENALQQRLTKEELERRSKESMLSEVGGKALEAEEQVKVLRQRINEMEDQMKKTEVVYKDQIKEQENKTHSNWVTARNAERALNQEKLETSKLREKLVVLTSQLNERRAPLFRPNSGQPTGPRQGDSYGPSPVSGGAPSPPIMIEGPRRPPSAPVGRRIDPYGPRPPSDPHGRYADSKHIPSMDMMGPRSSSPSNMDGSTKEVEPQINEEAQAEASTDSPEPGPGSFLASPIRDSPGPMVPGPGHHDQFLPPGPHGRLPPPGPYRPRPGLYHHGPPGPNVPPLHGPPLPANGHPGMPMPGPMGGEFGPRPNGHAYLPRPGPGQGPLPPHFRPPPPHHFGPMPPPHGIRGPMGPRPPFPPDMRFPGPREHSSLPPGVPPHPAHPGEAYGQPPLNALHNSSGPYTGPQQDAHVKQEAPQDSTRPSTVKP